MSAVPVRLKLSNFTYLGMQMWHFQKLTFEYPVVGIVVVTEVVTCQMFRCFFASLCLRCFSNHMPWLQYVLNIHAVGKHFLLSAMCYYYLSPTDIKTTSVDGLQMQQGKQNAVSSP